MHILNSLCRFKGKGTTISLYMYLNIFRELPCIYNYYYIKDIKVAKEWIDNVYKSLPRNNSTKTPRPKSQPPIPATLENWFKVKLNKLNKNYDYNLVDIILYSHWHNAYKRYWVKLKFTSLNHYNLLRMNDNDSYFIFTFYHRNFPYQITNYHS